MPEARTLANDYLPQAAVDDPWWPTVAPVISHPDGTVHEGTIVVDLLLMLDAGDEARPLFIAHEMHHAYVRRHWPPVPPEADGSERLVHALDQLRMEGTADLIDKGMPFDSRVYPNAYREQYRDAYGRSDEILAAVNGLLERIDAEPGSTAAHAEALWTALPLAGHPTGAFMARRILDELGRARLMAALESPLAFARIYQEASAVPGGRPTFSDAALRVIDRLEAAAGGAGTRRTP